MTNATTSFQQVHQALTSIANNPAIGVVPTIVSGAPAFGAIGAPLARVPSPVQIDFLRPRPEFDAEAFVRANDDTVFLKEIFGIKRVLGTRLGDLLPDNKFFGASVTAVQAVRRDQIKKLVTPAGAKFSDMTVQEVAKRLATESCSRGDGCGRTGLIDHIDLIIDALLDRSRMFGSLGAPRDPLIAAGIILANINSPTATAMAEFALGETGVCYTSNVYDNGVTGAAILYGLAADMRDARCTTGVEVDNPIRANAAENWFSSLEHVNINIIGARIFFGMSEALRAGDYGRYATFAEQGSRMLVSKIDRRIRAPYLARYLWAKSENINRRGKMAEVDYNFWIEMEEGLSDMGESFHHGRGIEGMKLSAECWILRDTINLMNGV